MTFELRGTSLSDIRVLLSPAAAASAREGKYRGHEWYVVKHSEATGWSYHFNAPDGYAEGCGPYLTRFFCILAVKAEIRRRIRARAAIAKAEGREGE